MLSFLHPLSLSLTVRRRRRRRMKMSILHDAFYSHLAVTARRRRMRVRRREFSRFLPEEIIENIFTRLPVKSIIRFRCVSKYWRHQFQNPNFIKNHLNHAVRINKFNILLTKDNYTDVLLSTSSPFLSHALAIDYPLMSSTSSPRILGSSNGLVSIAIDSDICIWNPATREYKPVPGLSTEFDAFDDTDCVCFDPHGFGFDSKNEDYKLLIIVNCDPDDAVLEAGLYSLASNSWKNLGFIPYEFSSSIKKGFLLNGVLHWIATDLRTEPKSGVIVCFDISDETFFDVPLPPFNVGNLFQYYLGVWEGKLCLLHENHMEKDPDMRSHQNDHTDVWVMMGNKWSKHWKITAHMREIHYRRAIQTLQNGEILFEGESRVEESFDLISYDPKLERARALNIDGFPEQLEDAEDFEVETYIETLVALNSGTYVGQ